MGAARHRKVVRVSVRTFAMVALCDGGPESFRHSSDHLMQDSCSLQDPIQ